VTRIVGGSARGRRIAVPSEGTRPTSDRAREGLFNTLRSEVELRGARVLDLFAGSGAVGLEAISRGAVAAVFVESDRQAARVLTDNVTTLGFGAAASVDVATVAHYLSAAHPAAPFDFVFADPPYSVPGDVVAAMLNALDDDRFLSDGGVVVIERSSRDPEPLWPAGITMIKQRRYGAGSLWYGRRESRTGGGTP
jgi:16S rRNA (guanine966-N2)-methyltransferase